LVIADIKTDCSCTMAAIEKKTIRPGESIPLTIDFHVKGLFGKLPQHKAIVKSNDPQSPTTLLTIKAERKPEFALKPLYALLGIIPMGTEKILLMKITPGSEDRHLSIKEAKSSSPFLEISPLENERNTKHYLLKFRLLPTVPPGLFHAVVRIPCIGASRKVLQIPVQAEIVGPIKTSLTQIQFGLIHLGEDNKTKRIKLRSGDSFDVLQTNCSQPWLEIVTKRLADNEYMLIVTVIPANTTKGKLEGAVNIETNVPAMSKISIPVYAFRL